MLGCLTGPPASQQLRGAGPLPAEEEAGSQAAGIRRDFQVPFLLGSIGLLCSLLKPPRGCQSQQHVLSLFGPKWAWLCAPCPQPCLAEAVLLDK